MNSCWGLQITITVTENAVIGLAVGTGLHLAALPFPQLVDLPQKVKFEMYNKGCFPFVDAAVFYWLLCQCCTKICYVIRELSEFSIQLKFIMKVIEHVGFKNCDIARLESCFVLKNFKLNSL